MIIPWVIAGAALMLFLASLAMRDAIMATQYKRSATFVLLAAIFVRLMIGG